MIETLSRNSIFDGSGMNRALRCSIAGVAAVLYGLSLSLPTYTGLRGRMSSGEEAFQMGWSPISTTEPRDADMWILSASWLANPAIWVGMLAAALGRWRLAAVAAALGSVLCLLALTRFAGLIGLLSGFWLWSASAGFLLATSAMMACREMRVD